MKIEMIENKRCCRECRFFFKESDHRGQCRRYPPQVWCESNPETSCGVGNSFPEMRNEEWCGEFQPEEKGWVMPEGFVLVDPHAKKEESNA